MAKIKIVYFYFDDAENNVLAVNYKKHWGEGQELADAYAKKLGRKLAGGLFTSDTLPYNFKKDYKVIELPKGFKAPKPVPLEKQEMTPYLATAIAEGFCEGEGASQELQKKAWQYLIDTGLAYRLQGWFGRTDERLIEAGVCVRPS